MDPLRERIIEILDQELFVTDEMVNQLVELCKSHKEPEEDEYEGVPDTDPYVGYEERQYSQEVEWGIR